MKRFCKLLYIVWVCLCAVGCEYAPLYEISDYRDFLNGYTHYAEYVPAPVEPPNPIAGFAALANMRFDYGTPFGGGYAYVKKDGKNYALGYDGTLKEIETDLSGITLIDGKYAYEADGKFGVNDIFGNRIADAVFDSVDIAGDTVLAREGDELCVLRFGEYAARAHASGFAYLIDEFHVYFEGRIRGLDLSPLTADGAYYSDVPHEGFVAVTYADGGMGYVSLSTGERVGEVYSEVTEFSQGEACAVTFDGLNIVIDTQGNVLYSSRINKLCALHGDYRCYVRYNGFGVMDFEFREVTGAVFSSVKYERAFGDYIIVGYGSSYGLYSLADKAYTDVYGDDIECFTDVFSVVRDGSTVLLDFGLETIAECSRAWYSDGVLTVESEGEYAYYLDMV